MDRILYLNNCWFTNVGEAFIDIGAMKLLKLLFPEAIIANFSNMTEYYTNRVIKSKAPFLIKTLLPYWIKKGNIEFYDMWETLSADYVVMAGMFATKEFCHSRERRAIENLIEKGAKLILLGIGGIEYTESEKIEFEEFLKLTKPLILTTRDMNTYELYKDSSGLVYPAIDCALWVNDVYDPRNFKTDKYNIAAFNRIDEPKSLPGLDINTKIVRPYHFQVDYNKKNLKTHTFISDTPYDYLTLYANADKVYTDLVHATLISLLYGTPVKYYFFDNRCKAFEAIKGLYKDEQGFLYVAADSLKKQKEKIVQDIKIGLGVE